ncbi:MAG: site-2 protease family protein [Fimbriimonadaceae bacterium]|nr:site-2 protease family protein [Fimbriimonadaceae bacterium]
MQIEEQIEPDRTEQKMSLAKLNAFLNWSVSVGRLFGIPIKLHISLVFFLYPVLMGWGMGVWHTLEYVLLIVLSILLHEFGHALTAKRYRLTGLSITLHGFGGFAVSSGYRSPKQALIITLMGPAVTFAVAGFCLSVGTLGLNAAELGSEARTQFLIVHAVGFLNLMLGFLNLIPSYPFDGGHAVQAILNRKQDEFKSMRVVFHLGLVVSILVLVYGLISGHSLVTIFGLIGGATSLVNLRQTGGIRFREPFQDRKSRKEAEAARMRERARDQAFLSDVMNREKAREERERLRKILEASLDDE